MIGFLAVTAANAEHVKMYTDNCDINYMREQLDRAVAKHHAVITSVICDKDVVVKEPVVEPVAQCGETIERIVNREYFVRETVQTYRPVVHYELADTYTTMRFVCDDANCGM